jgi:hypothetical protein
MPNEPLRGVESQAVRMSAFHRISSALPLKEDVAAADRESPKLNIPLEIGRGNLE